MGPRKTGDVKGDTPLDRSTGASPLWTTKTVWEHSLRQGLFAPKREPCCLSRDEKSRISIREVQEERNLSYS